MAITVRAAGLVLVEHEFEVPLDHARPDGEKITVFAREVADPDGRDRPFLVFLQGGPGFEAPRPMEPSGWLGRALRDHRVLMLDQRGTGRSTPVGDPVGDTARAQADYLTHFRADSIVRDCELIREALGVDRWSVLGQSFGGFCAFTYLSFAPQGLRAAYITGGVPPVGLPPEEFFRATHAQTMVMVERYYERYPEDRGRIRELHDLVESKEIRLPSGDRLTGRRVRQLGALLGMSDGPERLHYLLELPVGSRAFGYDWDNVPMTFARNPIYALLNEACVADGVATRWVADRVLPEVYREDVTTLTGEHMLPWLYDDVGALAPYREAANLLAEHEWPRLFDEDQLRHNEVPVAAAVYADDPYVVATLSMRTAGMVKGMRPWLTNEYLHNGLRAAGDRIVGRLFDLAAGRA
jgi:pimeloyl-ACP methyl ester carboxylesterase